MAGEIGVIFNIPQPFTVRTKRLSQVVRISHHHFKQLIQSRGEDGKIIIANFMKVCKLHLSPYIGVYSQAYSIRGKQNYKSKRDSRCDL